MPSTRTKSPQRKLQEGQAIVLIALLILVLFGMLGLAVDSGRSYVDRRDQQAAVDAAALAAGDWYDNYPDYLDVAATTIPQATQVYQNNLHLYGPPAQSTTHNAAYGLNNALTKDTWTDTWATQGYQLTITAINTLFNGYQFQFDSTHAFPLAFMQIFGGPPNVTIVATASSIVGNQRQTPALLTLDSNPGDCGVGLGGNGKLTILGDVYSNSGVCVSSALHLAGNCYGAAGAACSAADYYCYNSTPGFVPYAPPCLAGDITGGPNVPAPSLPDPGYIAPSVPYYQAAGVQMSRGGYTEMTPGLYNSFSPGGCDFLDPGVYSWNGGYSSHGGMVSNELKAPNEEAWGPSAGTTAQSAAIFWGGCAGTFTATTVSAPGNGMKHQGGNGNWGIELTAVRYDQFIDPTLGAQNPCFNSPGCRRESAPSACTQLPTIDANNQGIQITITQNSPGAQYYLAYINPFGCLPYPNPNTGLPGTPNDFSYVGRYLAPGFTDAAGNPPALGAGPTWTGNLVNVESPAYPCGLYATVSICNITYNTFNIQSPHLCFAQVRTAGCETPDDETQPQCFSSCPPSASTPQENAKMDLQYPPLYTGGDVSNENFCVVSPNPGDPNAPCTTAKVTPGAVQFYFPNNQCMDQNGNGYTHVFSGEQYNWIVIYAPPGTGCSGQKLNGNAFTQYIGTIYTPGSSWDILGTDKAPLAGQVICYQANVTGNGSAGIDFNPNYAPAPPAARLIN